jgi:lipopolysaccharide transport system ATP-binding protein
MVVAPSIPLADSDTLVRVSGVSKKFCLSLKKSLWYGLCDMGRELTGRRRGGGEQGPEGDGRAGLRPKEFWAVNNVSFDLKRGECLGLIGRNGAGKTTLLKMLNGLIKPDAGQIEMRGRVGALIALGAGFNPVLTGRENIYVNGSVLGLTKKEIDAKLDEIVDFAEIGDFIDTPVQNYSSGMAVRLGFAVASSINPDILLIDEVLAVGDLSFVFKCLNRIADILPRCAVIFVSHQMPLVARTCSRVIVMDRGQEIYSGESIAQGIEIYSKDAGTSKTNRQNVGGQEVSLVSIGLRSSEEQAYNYDNTLQLANGAPLEIQLELKSNVDVPLAFSPFIKILDQQLREVVDVFPFHSDPLFKLAPRDSCRIHLYVDAMHLNRGLHSIAAGAFEPRAMRNYARVNSSAFFYAESEMHGWAATVMPGQWKLV